MNPYPQRAGNAFGIRAGSGQAAADPTKNATNSQQADPGGNFTNTNISPNPAPSGSASGNAGGPNTVLVTPQNASLYGFDRIGSTINTDTGGLMNPFRGPADGLGAGRDLRNRIVQNNALGVPQTPYQPPAQPAPTTTGTSTTTPANPYVPPPAAPATTTPGTTTSTTAPNGTQWAFTGPGILNNGQAVNTGSSPSGTGSTMSTPNVETQGSNSQPPPAVTVPTNGGSSYQMPTVQAAQTPRNSVLNAMMRRYDPRGW